MEPTYYRIIASKATFVEGWRVAGNLFEFALFCIIKTFRLSFLATYAVTNEGFKRLDWDELLDDVQASLLAIRSEFETAGFRYCFCYCYPTLGSMTATEMVLLSGDGNSNVSVKHERHQSGTFVNSVITTTIISELSNGNFLTTCDRQDIMPPEFLGERHKRFSASRLAQRHIERITEVSPAYPISLRDDYEVERRVLDIEQRLFQRYLERGMLAPLSAEQVERYQAQSEQTTSTTSPSPSVPESPATPVYSDTEIVGLSDEHVIDATLADGSLDVPVSRYPGVIAELEKIRNKKGSWLSGAVILGVSIALFLGAGAARWDWKFALLLIPILLFHEMGHFVAMRLFKYRNMKMFFIPLLGAAVTGQNYNVAGWKKAIVSLAGPVPGIFVGSVLGVVALVLGDQELLLEAAALTVFLNAFNLLPFLPLDGGWIVHVLLFSRHHVLDTTFRLLAAIALILSGLLGFRILMFMGVMMLIGLKSAYRVARVSSEVRNAGIDTSSPDGQTIPIETADEIISRLDAAASLPVLDPLKAQQTLQVFESVNARPPGVLGTLALTGVHVGSLVVAIVFIATFTIAQHADLGDFMRAAATAPQNLYECGTAKQWPPAADRLPVGTASTVVATFPSVDEAEAAFGETKAAGHEGVLVTHFGPSVLVTLDAESEQIDAFVAQFKSTGAEVQMATASESLLITVDTTLPTGKQAIALEQKANEYFSLPIEMAAIPPWGAAGQLSAQQELARRTYKELVGFSPFDDERYAEISSRMTESIKQKDQAKTQTILQEQRALVQELKQKYHESLLLRDDLDKAVIEVYSRQPQKPDWSEFAPDVFDLDRAFEEFVDDETESTNDGKAKLLAAQAEWRDSLRSWQIELGSHMGQLPLEGDSPAPSACGIIGGGGVERTGLMLRFWINFNQPDDGAVAIANWLCGYDCFDVKYAFGYDE
ncbi:MAG: hypothetical protein H8E66_29670 [Planctomycetes bacterium]|nr:hypothetical protein [Planctomycetota bacterium]